MAVIEVIQNDLFDLSGQMKSKIKQSRMATKTSIESYDQFKVRIDNVLKLRSKKSTDQNLTSSRSHLIIEFSFEGSSAKLAFVDLAGWENPHNKLDLKETSFINSSLASFNSVLANISQRKIPSFDSSLSKIFKPYLDGKSSVCMLYHVNNSAIKKGLENIKNVVPANKEQISIGLKRECLQDVTNSKRFNNIRN